MSETLIITDEEAAERVQMGEREAFGILVERYLNKLIRYGKRFVADRDDIEDLVQDVFISAYQNIQSFDAKRKFSPWIYRIAHNAFVNALAASERRPALISFDPLVSHPAYEDTTDSLRDQQEMKTMIDKGLSLLIPKYREVLVLNYFEQLSYKDIADVLKVPIGTVGIRLSRAKEELKKHINLQ